MKNILIPLLIFGLVATVFSGCVTSRVTPIVQTSGSPSVSGDRSINTPELKIFLLERDIPPAIEQLGIVSIAIQSRTTLGIDDYVKQQLRRDCQRLGANGAYRISDGTYYPIVVSYLVFRY